jgi:putative ABC transport system substrate-binding protein
VYRIAIMSPADPVAEMTEAGNANYKAFFSELRRLGYVEGGNLVVERRSGGGQTARYPEFALEVVQRQPHLIFALSGRVAKAFQGATTTIPIVAITADPTVDNIVPSLARPGGNLTGFSSEAGELSGKHLELLEEMVPTASRVAFLSPRAGWELASTQAMRQAFNQPHRADGDVPASVELEN